MSLFSSLNVGKSALTAQTVVLNTISHNVANASTDGYSRQTVNLTSVSSYVSGGMYGVEISTGGGVEAVSVTRSRSDLYDKIYRNVSQDYNAYSKMEDMISQIELLFNEPSDDGLSGIINDFFNAWQELSNDPTSMAARNSLKSIAEELTDRMHGIYDQLLTMQLDVDDEISAIPGRINEITSEIADLNASIRVASIKGDSGNDLRDKRDLLVDELSEYVDVRVVEKDNGAYTVLIGNSVVVEQDSSTELTVSSELTSDSNIKKTVIVAANGTEFEPTSGTLGALIDIRDGVIPEIIGELNTIAESLVTYVNFEHRDGYGLNGDTEMNFFDPTKTMAFNITLSSDIDDISNIAASGDGAVGDNSNALDIVALNNLKIVNQSFSLNEYYNSLISDIGLLGSEAQSGRENQELLLSQIDNARESVKGVNIDEELVNLIQAQQIYQSASRVIVTLDEMLDVVVNLT